MARLLLLFFAAIFRGTGSKVLPIQIPLFPKVPFQQLAIHSIFIQNGAGEQTRDANHVRYLLAGAGCELGWLYIHT